jgi:hypothetical protein
VAYWELYDAVVRLLSGHAAGAQRTPVHHHSDTDSEPCHAELATAGYGGTVTGSGLRSPPFWQTTHRLLRRIAPADLFGAGRARHH